MKRGKWVRVGIGVLSLVVFGMANTSAAAETQYMRVGGASIGGTWLLYAGKVVQIIQKEFPNIKASALVSGGGAANCVQIDHKKMELGFTHTVTANIAYNGKYYAKEKSENVRHVMSLFPAMLHFIASNKRPELKEFPDLLKKPYRMSVQSKTLELYANWAMELYGMSIDQLKKQGVKLSYLGIGNVANMMQDGNLDFGVIMDPYRSGGALQIDRTPGFHYLPVKVEEYLAKYPGWVKMRVPAGTYESIKEDYFGVATINSVVCHKDMPEDFVYKLLDAITKNLDILNEVIPEGLKVKPSDMPVGHSIPMHPGAEKYYRDRGLLK